MALTRHNNAIQRGSHGFVVLSPHGFRDRYGDAHLIIIVMNEAQPAYYPSVELWGRDLMRWDAVIERANVAALFFHIGQADGAGGRIRPAGADMPDQMVELPVNSPYDLTERDTDRAIVIFARSLPHVFGDPALVNLVSILFDKSGSMFGSAGYLARDAEALIPESVKRLWPSLEDDNVRSYDFARSEDETWLKEAAMRAEAEAGTSQP